MSSILIKNAGIISEGKSFKADLYIEDEKIAAIGSTNHPEVKPGTRVIEASGLILIPGVIDVHVHFREPGLTHKGDIFSETCAAVSGGVTSFMDMPNTIPQTVTPETLEEKYRIGSEKSLLNYSFYLGVTNDNLNAIFDTDPADVCGIKLFMGSSTGNMLVDKDKTLRELFRNSRIPIVAHCEDEMIIRKNSEIYRQQYGEDINVRYHPLIRSREACFASSSYAIHLANEYNTRLHICHLSTSDEMKLFSNIQIPEEKRITGEACVSHLWFDDIYYEELGTRIKINPAIKTRFDRDSLINAINNDLIDLIATDHAPHLIEEKLNPYFKSPSGTPFVQHSLVTMLELWHRKIFSLEKIVEKMCHNPARLFKIKDRGFIREGYQADICLINPDLPWTVSEENIRYKCGWSPLDGTTLRSQVVYTIVNGTIVFENGNINKDFRGQKLCFDRRR